MQDNRQPVFFGQLELGAVKRFLFGHRFGFHQSRHEKIQPDFADGHQPRVCVAQRQLIVQRLKVSQRCLGREQWVNAQPVAAAQGMRQLANSLEIADADGRNHALGDVVTHGAGMDSQDVAQKLRGIQVAVGVYPERHGVGFDRGDTAKNSHGDRKNNSRGTVCGWLPASRPI